MSVVPISHVRSFPKKKRFQKSQLPTERNRKHLLGFFKKIGVSIKRSSGILRDLALNIGTELAARLKACCPHRLPHLVSSVKRLFKNGSVVQIKNFFDALNRIGCLSHAEDIAKRGQFLAPV